MLILSFGGGVQSTTIALLAMHGVIEKPDYAIFADTGWETDQTLNHVEAMRDLLGFPLLTVKEVNLLNDLRQGLVNESYFTPPPFFHVNGSITKRQCTSTYKIVPIKHEVRRLLGAGLRTRLYGKHVVMQIGISRDEVHRAKPSEVQYIKHDFPLLNLGMTRLDCEKWLVKNGYKIPAKSACVGCPFHSDREWQRIKSDHLKEFEVVVGIDEQLRSRISPEFMHKSLKPINKVEFVNRWQIDLFGNECTGFCGV
jgi:hypothetical protein